MASVWNQVKTRYGLTTTDDVFNRMRDIYRGLGNPYGDFVANKKQLDLLNTYNNLWDTAYNRVNPYSGLRTSYAIGKPKTLGQQYAKAVLPKSVYTPVKFTEMIPMEQIVNRPFIEQWAYGRVTPEVLRLRTKSLRDYYNNIAQNNAYRFGASNVAKQDIYNRYERYRKELAQPYIQRGLATLQDYYNELMKEYYKDPQAFQFKPFDFTKTFGSSPLASNLLRRPTSGYASTLPIKFNMLRVG